MSGLYINANRVYSATEDAIPNVGDSVEGGLFVGTFVSGDTLMGLVVSDSDLSTNAEWGCQGTLIPEGASPEAIGQGLNNTLTIVGGCPTSGIAARLANDLVLNGFTDWFLPSYDELNLIYTNVASIGLGGFSNHSYWSSTQDGANQAFTINMNNGSPNSHNKSQTNKHTRAARYYAIGTITFPVSPNIEVNSSTATVIPYPSPPIESPTFYLEQPRTESIDNLLINVAIGAYFQGGIVVTYNQNTGVGTICTLEDIGEEVWGTEGVNISANANADGRQNTINILAQDTLRPIAASICDDFVINGYDDWFLPAPLQLAFMYNNLHLNGLGNFSTVNLYWSSRRFNNNESIAFDFSNGDTPVEAKSNPYLVRAMRSFTYLPSPQVNLIVSQ